MSEQWQIRRGTTQENDDFTGAQGELTMDTQKKQLRVHDGSTQGGAGIIDPVVAFQTPNSGNNYTWFRKYASGWVEQGGVCSTTNGHGVTITLPLEMSDSHYNIQVCGTDSTSGGDYQKPGWREQTTTTFAAYSAGANGSWWANTMYWKVEGMAA